MESKFKKLENILPNVSRETFSTLDTFAKRVEKWSSQINLIAPNTVPEIWERHILDSVQLFNYAPSAKKWMDLGSGGGFPALVLAILFKDLNKNLLNDEDKYFIRLVESNQKKGAFLRSTILELDLPAEILNQRIEDLDKEDYTPEVITARALAPLPLLLKLIYPLASEDTIALLQKGRKFKEELDLAEKRYKFNYECKKSFIEKDSVILKISGLSK